MQFLWAARIAFTAHPEPIGIRGTLMQGLHHVLRVVKLHQQSLLLEPISVLPNLPEAMQLRAR